VRRRRDRRRANLILLLSLLGILALTAAGCGDPLTFVKRLLTPGRAIDRITVHHTASGSKSGAQSVDVTMVAGWHRQNGIGMGYKDSRACAYHYLILRDGRVQAGRPIERPSSGTKNAQDNRATIAICLVGDFGSRRAGRGTAGMHPTEAQLAALEKTALWAFDRYGFGSERVRGHREVAASECPGDNFNLDGLRSRLRKAQESGREGAEPPLRFE